MNNLCNSLERAQHDNGGNVHVTFKSPVKYTYRNRSYRELVFIDLYKASDFDHKEFTPKKDCELFRYTSERSLISGICPIICINRKKALLYFYDDKLQGFENKGITLEDQHTNPFFKDWLIQKVCLN